jgi:hypothetical protein
LILRCAFCIGACKASPAIPQFARLPLQFGRHRGVSGFAETIDPRIETEVIACPPDTPRDYACAWRFTLKDSAS